MDETAGNVNQVFKTFMMYAIKIASGDNFDRMMMMAQSADNPTQMFGRALYFVLSATMKKMQADKIDVPSELFLAEKGIIAQTSQIVSALLISSGAELDPDSIQQGMAIAAQQLANDHDVQQQQPEAPQANQQPNQQPQPQPQPQQGGLLTQAQGAM